MGEGGGRERQLRDGGYLSCRVRQALGDYCDTTAQAGPCTAPREHQSRRLRGSYMVGILDLRMTSVPGPHKVQIHNLRPLRRLGRCE